MMNNSIFTNAYAILLLITIAGKVNSAANNSLSDCQAVAANFHTTVSGPVSNITSTTGTNVTCSMLRGNACPGSTASGSCVFQHKLAVSCNMSGSIVKIRVQSNGLPLYCPSVPSSVTITETNIDFEVNFNPDVDVNSPIQTATTSSDLSNILCNIQQTATPPSGSSFVNYGSSLITHSGVSIDGVSILNANSADSVDPFYPVASFSAEMVDSCLGHPQQAGIYHYHMASGCAKSAPVSVSACASVPACNSNISQYSIDTFTNYKTLTVIGLAKDGHVIYGPYRSSGTEVTSGVDICNGMFYDSIGNYAYFATRKYTYVVGCFGPGNYPSVSVNCSLNAPSSYSMSSFAMSLTTTSTTTTTTTATTTTTTSANVTTTRPGSIGSTLTVPMYSVFISVLLIFHQNG